MAKPLRLTSSLREKVWGKTRLTPWFPDSAQPIGEAWYLADHELPLLVKLIFTSERLSVQVHPDDGEDGPRGKNEMWHILEAEPGATIALGFREPITRRRLLESTRTGEVEQLLHWILLGILAASAVSSVMNWPVIVTTPSLVLSFAVCSAIGIFFGWYPAKKAAGLNPIDALRYE